MAEAEGSVCAAMPINETDPDLDRYSLDDLYRQFKVSWEKLLAKFGLPPNIGIRRTMTLGEAKAFAGKQANLNGSALGLSGFSSSDLDSIKEAIRQEIAAGRESIKTGWLDIDGIEHLPDAPGSFVYRLVLSSPVHFGSDQPVTFSTRHPRDTIQAVVVRSDDQGLVVECQKALPTDAKFLSLSFDPAFILRALENFILEAGPKGRLACDSRQRNVAWFHCKRAESVLGATA